MKRISDRNACLCVCRAEMKRIFRPEGRSSESSACVCRAEMKRIFRLKRLLCVCRAEMKRIVSGKSGIL